MTDTAAAAGSRSRVPRWLIGAAVMLTTIMVILDMTIVNVSLPHMMGALGATSDQITWVLTTYIVVNAIFIPMTGFFAALVGRKRLMLISISGFVVSSALCGQAHSLTEMVVFRALQGAFGAAVIPLSQAILIDAFPAKERGKAMALWGIGVMLGPVLGPTLGGFITQHLTWRWVFYINVPVGLINILMVTRFLRDSDRHRVNADWWGALLMAVGIGALQLVLDRGNQDDWFVSNLILALSIISALSLIFFIRRSWGRDDSVAQIQLLKDGNLRAACGMMALFGLGLFGTIILQPIMLEQLLNYPAETTGLVMAPRGIGSALSMFLVSRLIGRVDARRIIFLGLFLSALGSYFMTWYNLIIDPAWIIWPSVLQGLGMGMIFVPLSTLAYETLPRAAIDHAAALFNLFRTIGSSVGISIAGTLLSRETQINWNRLGGHINPYNPALQHWLHGHGLAMSDPLTPKLLANDLSHQAMMVAFVDTFWFITLSMLAIAPLVLLLRRQQRPDQDMPPPALH
jgi:DHA2 family multidrug resistance protein